MKLLRASLVVAATLASSSCALFEPLIELGQCGCLVVDTTVGCLNDLGCLSPSVEDPRAPPAALTGAGVLAPRRAHMALAAMAY